ACVAFAGTLSTDYQYVLNGSRRDREQPAAGAELPPAAPAFPERSRERWLERSRADRDRPRGWHPAVDGLPAGEPADGVGNAARAAGGRLWPWRRAHPHCRQRAGEPPRRPPHSDGGAIARGG